MKKLRVNLTFIEDDDLKNVGNTIQLDIKEARKYKLIRSLMIDDFYRHEKIDEIEIVLDKITFDEDKMKKLLTDGD